MSEVRSAMCALALSLLFLVPLTPNAGTPAQPAIPSVPSGEASYVRIHVPGAAVATLGPGVEVIETYESFVLARATENVLSALRARGVSVQPEDPFALRINGYAFDTRTSVEVPALLAAEPVLEGRGYYLVQFVGPIKPQWVGGVRHLADMLATYRASRDWDPARLLSAVRSLRRGSAMKRLGYLAETLWPGETDIPKAALEVRSAGLVKLDPAIGATGRISKRWGLRVNASIDRSAAP